MALMRSIRATIGINEKVNTVTIYSDCDGALKAPTSRHDVTVLVGECLDELRELSLRCSDEFEYPPTKVSREMSKWTNLRCP